MQKKYKPKGTLLAALDIGSTKIACFIARVTDDQGGFEVLGVGHHASGGVQSGTIVDLSKAEAAVRHAVHAAENMAADVMKGYPLREVIVGLPGVHARTHAHAAEVNVAGHEITDNDVLHALAGTQGKADFEDRELIHTIPMNYRLDDKENIRDPRGMHGNLLGVDIHLVSGDVNAMKNMSTCVERSHLDVGGFCAASYAAGLSSLVEDELDLGCTLIDIGGGVTSFAVFQAGKLLYADAVPIGGKHVTNDIAQGLTTSLSDAERIKVLYGSSMASMADENEYIDVPKLGESHHDAPNHIPRSLLVGIIQPRLEEIFEFVRAKLGDSGLGHSLGRRVVLTGGESQLPGMRDLAQHVLDKQVRIGRPIRISGLPDSVSGPAFSAVSGLLTYACEHNDEAASFTVKGFEAQNIWQSVKRWLRENW